MGINIAATTALYYNQQPPWLLLYYYYHHSTKYQVCITANHKLTSILANRRFEAPNGPPS